MDNLQTISQVTKTMGVSTRMLRYYEEIGLLQSKRTEGYAYRVYDEAACLQLSRILVLRKLRIPLKQIGILLSTPATAQAMDILTKNMRELNVEIDSLSTIRTILQRFIDTLQQQSNIHVMVDLLSDDTLLSMLAPLSPEKLNFKEEKNMEDLTNANEQLNKLTDNNVRIVYLPPSAVASSHFIGENPEEVTGNQVKAFIQSVNLPSLQPGFHLYGFNNPSPTEENSQYGYEFIVTIPDDLTVEQSLVKKHFPGGLYMAHCIKMGDFHMWRSLYEYALNHDVYEIDSEREPQGMFGALEDHLNAHTYYTSENQHFAQLDLLIPIKPKG